MALADKSRGRPLRAGASAVEESARTAEAVVEQK